MFQSIFNLPGMGFYGNAISHMQLLTPLCHVLLAAEAALTFGAREAACIYSVVTELGKTLSDGQSMQEYKLKTEGMEGFGERKAELV